MMNNCPNCGIKIKSEFNFCPNCGKELLEYKEEIKEKETPPVVTGKEGKIICPVCGEENDPLEVSCTTCGADLIKTETSAAPAGKVYEPKLKKKPAAQSPPANGKKSLPLKNVLAIVIIILLIIFVILLLSGVFEPVQQVQHNVPRTENPGVDLNRLEHINELERQAAENPNDPDILLHLANTQSDAGFFERAIDSYQKYLALRPEDADARIDLGVCYFNLKNYPRAAEEMERALNYSPRHQIGHLNLGIVNLADGKIEVSKQWLAKAVEIDPESEAGRRAKSLLDSH
jgi:tetratricopeptide (TPR) repeat protein